MKLGSKRLLKISVCLFVGIILIYLLNLWIGPYLKIFHKPRAIRHWIMSFGRLGFLAYAALQIVQVMIGIIPGEVIQAAGGYVFGTFGGAALSLSGILIGSIITFVIARKIGEPILKKIMPAKHFTKMESLLNKPQNKIILFFLYLVPGVPKDLLGYISGISPIRIRDFAIICVLARVPGVFVSTYFGSNLYKENYMALIIISIILVILLVVGISHKEKISAYIK